ncbi:MAG: ribonuclease III [Eubacterium sp.]|nr:ribonuclease III [Eubacterium sp.]
MSKQTPESFSEIIGYKFSDGSLLENALTHSSYANDHGLPYERNNERLEFLGDAVLELVTSRFLFEKYPEKPEGELTTTRAALVCESSLAEAARQIQLGDYLLLGRGEIKTGGASRDSILSDAFEAVIGSLYLDGGFSAAETFVRSFLLTDIESKQLYYDSKSHLQEIVQEKYHENSSIRYEVIDEWGPPHNKSFRIRCVVQGEELAVAEGHTKKKAEAEAAYQALMKLRKD